MDIRFVSSLTAEDENLFAPVLLKALAALLDPLPIAYTVRIETTGAHVLQHANKGVARVAPAAAAPRPWTLDAIAQLVKATDPVSS